MSREELLVLRKTLVDLLDKGWIRTSASPASSPVLFAKKPSGGLRFCVDYRGLNAITKKDRYPLPLIRETLRQLSKARWFTKIDVRAVFHRLRIKEGDEWKTAFRTRQGLFEWLVCSFGLCGALETFQRFINNALREYLDIYCSAYLDDVIIYTDGDLQDHYGKVRKVIDALKIAGLRMDIEKCAFGVKEIKYLGFIIEIGNGIKVDPEKVSAITKWEEPETVSAVHSFLGFANFYREFIHNFSAICEPSNNLTKNGAAWTWEEPQRKSFDKLKGLLITAPVLKMFDPEAETILEADSSGYAIGGVVSQLDEKRRLRPVGFFSRKLTAAESNYEIHDKELLAILSTTNHFRKTGKSQYNSIANQDLKPIGQAPSLPKTTVVERPPKGKDIFGEINIQKLWDQAIKKDPSFKIIYSSVAKGERSLPSSVENSIQMPNCTFDDKLALTYRGALWVPDWEPLCTALIQQVHDSHVTGHPGREVTLSILARNFFWPQQYKDVRRFVRNCHVCGRSKVWRQSSQGLLRPLPIPDRFHSELAADFMTELALTDKNERFLVVIHDRLLGSATLEAMETMEAEKCAERFLVGIQQRLCTAFHPQTDGGTERINQEVLTYLRAYISYAQNDWAKLLPSAMVAIKNRDSSKSGFSPFFLTHGYHLDPIQRRAPRSSSTKDPKSRANAFVNRLYDGQELAKAAMATAQQIMEHNAI
ncbi:hypothetical protein K3495_g11802 [Podosphaera aphanis]|nr:hypothetical protein K3495_g11802 [Podosphaera aphanis]